MLDKFSVIVKQVQAKEVHFCDGIVYLCGENSHITILDGGAVVNLDVKKLTSKAQTKEKMKDLGLSLGPNATVTQMKTKLALHKTKVEKMYKDKGFKSCTINFWSKETNEQPTFSSFCIVDRQLLYAACLTEEAVVAVTTSIDGVGVRGHLQRTFSYGVHWGTISSLCIVSAKLFAVTCLGIEMFDLASASDSIHVVDKERHGCHPFQVKGRCSDIIFSDPTNRRIYKYVIESAKLEVFAGNGKEDNVDGPAAECSFRQPCGITVEFDNVVYATDAMSGTVLMISPLTNTIRFLKAIGDLHKAFSVHEKGKKFDTFGLQPALDLVQNCRTFLEENEQAII